MDREYYENEINKQIKKANSPYSHRVEKQLAMHEIKKLIEQAKQDGFNYKMKTDGYTYVRVFRQK